MRICEIQLAHASLSDVTTPSNFRDSCPQRRKVPSAAYCRYESNIDNGSTDSTPEIFGELDFEFEILSGLNVSSLRNHSAKMAKGRYLAFVDADVEL